MVIAAVDQFTTNDKGVLANSLYVAMTRVRSILAVFGKQSQNAEKNRLLSALEECVDCLVDRPCVEKNISGIDELEEVAERLGAEDRAWLESIWRSQTIEQEPIVANDGQILAEPLFWFRRDSQICACFGRQSPSQRILDGLADAGITVLSPGDDLPGVTKRT